MRKVHWLLILRASSLVGLGLSAALLVDYTSLEPSFCGLDSGCGAVRASGFGFLPIPGLGFVPVPALGVLGFSLLLGLTLLRDARTRKQYATPLAYSIAVIGVVLFALQALVIREFCPYCVVADLASVVIGVATYALRDLGWFEAETQESARSSLVDVDELLRTGSRSAGWQDDSRVYSPPTPLVRRAPREPFRLHPPAWALLGLVFLVVPFLYPRFARTNPTPAVVTELYRPGKLNVVEFFDFECPHCRDLAPRLKKVLATYGDRVHFVRQYVPLPGHERARPAARMAVCAEEQGKGEALSERLLEVDDLSDEGLWAGATAVGADLAVLRACLGTTRSDERLKRDLARLEKAGFLGLPTTYVEGTRLLGAQQNPAYRDALERAAAGEDRAGLSPVVFWALAAALVAALVGLGRVRVRQVTTS